METKNIRTCSIDIGKKNFAICIEEFNVENAIRKVSEFPIKTLKYESNGTLTENSQNLLNSIFSCGKIVFHENYDLTQNCDAKKKLDTETLYNMNKVLDDMKSQLDLCTHIVIEEQMKNNITAIKLAQHCFSYFLLKYGKAKNIVEFPSFHKTKVLGAPKVKGKVRWKAMSKPQRKKWAIEEASNIMLKNKQIKFLRKMVLSPKKDDLSDTFLMGKAFQWKHVESLL